MISISFWSLFLCDCFVNDLMFDMIVFKISQRIYQIHRNHSLCCKWYLQAERVRDTHTKHDRQVEQARLIEQQSQNFSAQIIENVMNSWQSIWKKLIQQQIDENRIEKKRQETEKIKAEIFACRRCSVKFSNNIKLHQHICDHHTKKSKFVVSNSFTTFSQSIIFLFDSSKSATQSKILSFISSFTFSISIFSSPFTSKRVISSKISSLSGSAPEFVSKHSENTFICSFTSSFISQKSATMRPTFLFKSIFKTSSKFYLTIDDLFSMFVEKDMRAKLFAIQNSFFSSDIFVLRQTRIISYFLLVIKSTKFENFTSVYDSIKQSIRISSSRSFSSRFSFSIRFLFSTSFYFFSVCWRCQKSFVICLFRN